MSVFIVSLLMPVMLVISPTKEYHQHLKIKLINVVMTFILTHTAPACGEILPGKSKENKLNTPTEGAM